MPKHERGISTIHCQLIQVSEWWLAVMNPMRTGDEGRNYILHPVSYTHLTLPTN